MPTYVTKDDSGTILACAYWQFPESELVDFDVVRGHDGKLYKYGEEPQINPDTILDSELAKIIADFELKFDDLRKAQASAVLIGGDSLAATQAQLSAKWAELAEKCDKAINDKIDELTEVQNG